MPVKCYETEYKNFGRCVCLENDIIKLMATVDVGPRIIYFGLCGNENILFEDIDRNFYEMNKGYGIWYAYGGHRLWSAPETMPETYLPDNHYVDYSFKDDTLTLTPQTTISGKQFSIVCRMSDKNKVKIENRITNCSSKPQSFAPWSVTGFSLGGTEFIPLCSKNTGFLPNRTMALWSYSDINDKRFTLADNYATLKHNESESKAFKVGFNVNDGFIIYTAGNQIFKKTFDNYKNTNYPDFGCNFETYTNKHFLECELLGEEREYMPSETAIISETWEIRKTEWDTEKIISEYINNL